MRGRLTPCGQTHELADFLSTECTLSRSQHFSLLGLANELHGAHALSLLGFLVEAD